MNWYRPGETIYFPFDTFKSSDGSSITMSGLALGDILIYKDGGVTQRASTTGFTLLDTDGIDFDALTGIHGFSVDLSSDATADFFKAGSTYWIVISAITVDALTVSFVGERFRIGYPTAIFNTSIATLASQTSFTLTTGPAEDDALNGLMLIVHDKASAVQMTHVVIEDYTGATKTVTLRAVPATTFTIAAGDNVSVMPEYSKVDVSHLLGTAWLAPGTAGTPDVNTKLVGGTAQTGGDLKTLIDAVDNFVDTEIADIQARLPAALVGGKMDSDATAISGDATAADNLEKEYDGTGFGPILQRTTIATLASQTSFTLTAGSADNDAYNGCVVVVEDAATAAQKAVGVVLDYTGATKTVTLLNDPAVFTMAATDLVTIIACRALKPLVDNRVIDIDATKRGVLIQGTKDQLDDLNDLSAAQVNTEADTAILDAALVAKLDTIDDFLDTEIAAIKAKTDQLTFTVANVVDANALRIGGTVQTGFDLGATRAEPAQGAPAATTTWMAKIDYLYKNWRNKKTQTATQWSLLNDDAVTVDHKSTVADDGTTASKAEIATGP